MRIDARRNIKDMKQFTASKKYKDSEIAKNWIEPEKDKRAPRLTKKIETDKFRAHAAKNR